MLCGAASENAACRQVAAGIIALAEAGDDHAAAGGGVDELSTADVNAHVAGRRAGVVGAKEEHQIAGLQLTLGDGVPVIQLGRRTMPD